jgi:hypothetical protein
MPQNSVYFAIILVYMGYDGQSIDSQLPHQTVPMATQQWSMIAFGIISYVVVVSTCLMVATNRALSLSSSGALSHKLQVISVITHHATACKRHAAPTVQSTSAKAYVLLLQYTNFA